jgi:hypothetical protein
MYLQRHGQFTHFAACNTCKSFHSAVSLIVVAWEQLSTLQNPQLSCSRPYLLATLSELQWRSQSQNQSYITIDGQSASLSWNKAPILGLRPDLYYCPTVASLLIWDAPSDERAGLWFTFACRPMCECIHSCMYLCIRTYPCMYIYMRVGLYTYICILWRAAWKPECWSGLTKHISHATIGSAVNNVYTT